MDIGEIKALWEMSAKCKDKIYVNYIKPGRNKTGVAYIDNKDIKRISKYVFRLGYLRGLNTEITDRNIAWIWDYDKMLAYQAKYEESLIVELRKQNGARILVPIKDVFLQNEKKMNKIRILYGQS